MDLVCIPFHDLKLSQSEGFRTRDAHMYAHFAKSDRLERVIILNRPSLAAELALGRKRLRAAGELVFKRSGVSVTKVSEKLFCVDMLDFSVWSPLVNGKGFLIDLYRSNSDRFKLALDFLGVDEYVTYESSPLTYELCSTLFPKSRIFDGVDNLCKHATYRRYAEKLNRIYREVLAEYEYVYFNSVDSLSYFGASGNKNVEFLSNGVDFDHFRSKSERPKAYEGLTGPIAVYAGKMQELFDVDLMRELALSRPDCTFFLLGKLLKKDIKERLAGIGNIVFLGDVIYGSLPAYICHSDICIIPYDITKQHGGDPIKFYEYMAANKPVVSTEIGEISKYHNGKDAFVCSKEDFIASFETALSETHKISRTMEREITWAHKSSYILNRVLSD